MAALACARALAGAGMRVLMVEKGRGIGGRVATRRVSIGADEISFDHGAQYLRTSDRAFRAMLQDAGVQEWQDDSAGPMHVGVPGMSALPRALAQGLEVVQSAEVTGLEQLPTGWRVTSSIGALEAGLVIATLPAPQLATLLGASHPLSRAVAAVRMAPSLTLMAAFPAESPRPFASRLDPDHPLVWIAQDSSKPGRNDACVTWVAQASEAFSDAHLEDAPAAIAARMLPDLCDVIGADPGTALHVVAHRWRYAQTAQALGQPFLRSDDGRLYLGGDWCLGARVEHAWASGRAIAADISGRRDVG